MIDTVWMIQTFYPFSSRVPNQLKPLFWVPLLVRFCRQTRAHCQLPLLLLGAGNTSSPLLWVFEKSLCSANNLMNIHGTLSS